MRLVEDEVVTLNPCQKCGQPLKRIVDGLKFRRPTVDPEDEYPGTLLKSVYFNCIGCNKIYMSPKQFNSPFLVEASKTGEFVFVLAPLQTPLVKVEVVDWLKE
jgi:hypothetical protein